MVLTLQAMLLEYVEELSAGDDHSFLISFSGKIYKQFACVIHHIQVLIVFYIWCQIYNWTFYDARCYSFFIFLTYCMNCVCSWQLNCYSFGSLGSRIQYWCNSTWSRAITLTWLVRHLATCCWQWIRDNAFYSPGWPGLFPKRQDT